MAALHGRLRDLRAAGRAGRRLRGSTPAQADRLDALDEALTHLIHHERLAVGAGDDASAYREETERNRAEAARLSACLEAEATALRRWAEEIPPPSFPDPGLGSEIEASDDLLRLLDLLLEEGEGLPGRLDLVEALIVQMSTAERRGVHRVALDPVTLTPTLERLSAQTAEASAADSATLEEAVLAFARRLTPETIAEVDREMTARKAGFGLARLAPSALRALVYYAVMRSNQRPRPEPVPEAAPQHDDSPEPSDEGRLAPASPLPPRRTDAVRPPAPAETGPDRAPARPLPAEAGWKIDPSTPPAPAAAEPPKMRRPGRARRLARVAVALIALSSAAWTWIHVPAGAVHVLSRSELRTLSPWLASGYRDRIPTHRTFVGQFAPEWSQQDQDRQRLAHADLVARLHDDGVSDVVLYDHRRRVVTHQRTAEPPSVD